ncbi:MAG: TetR/AcrR family transcriptional regulator [Alphaproteobacteria bacterium]|nr:MAG: TetR/AcrR family transcriptional regulator [Alphaproteobacteria bacterium]
MSKTQAVSVDSVAPLGPISPAKARILAVAVDLFHEKGYERTTVRDIAERTGILSGSLFHHFKSKQEILYTAMAMTTQAMGQSAEAAVTGVDDPVAQLKALILMELNSIHREDGHAAYVLVDEWRSLDPEHAAAVLKLRDGSYERCWMAALEGCADKGILKNNPRIARQLLRGALAWTRTWFRADGALTLPGLADEVCGTFLKS